ncbi:MAG: 23S rRNA (adenine(2503)-C(2))-methyltransferase RlmN [Acidimicrobiales bacterium]
MAAAVATTRYDLGPDDLAELLSGEPRYRVDQTWSGLYDQLREPDEMTNLPKGLRARLTEAAPTALSPTAEQTSRDGSTVKWLWELADASRVETVLMLYPDRATVCVSSQAGCAMACGFCATGQAGFERNLTTGEMVEQVVRAMRRAQRDGRRVSNVVFMGMGEPFANYDHTWRATVRIHDDLGLSARHITLSTVGIIPGIRRLTAEALPVNLAVSLHAADDDLRDELVPINRRYPLAELAEACHAYVETTHRRLSFEWALIDAVNDDRSQAVKLAAYARPLRAHVNLIPLNPTPGYATRGSSPDRVRTFCAELRELGVNTTVRRNRGVDIDAAGGQLRAEHEGAVTVARRH